MRVADGAVSDVVRATALKPPEPIAAPVHFQVTDDTVTWTAVENALSYEVLVRTEGGTWLVVACGGDGTVTRCAAIGLAWGDSFETRVRANPDPADEAQASSTWTATPAATTEEEAGGASFRQGEEEDTSPLKAPHQFNFTTSDLSRTTFLVT